MYKEMSAITYKLEWISHLLHDLHLPLILPVLMHCDNRVAQHSKKTLSSINA